MPEADDWFHPANVRARRREEQRTYRQPNRDTPVPIHEDGPRNWKPEDKASDAAMNEVLEILIRRQEADQTDIADELAATMDMKLGTARAMTSASLLFFKEAGWVEVVGNPRGRTVTWRLVG